MREYGKVFSRIWESADFRSLSEDGRTLVLYLLTCQHATIAGVFRVPDGYACEDLQWTVERVAKGFANLQEKGFATRCDGSMWVWVRKFLEWNPPENPNQRSSAAKVARTIPDSCAWKQEFMRVCGPSLGFEPPQEVPPKANPSATVSEPFANQEQEQKQEQKLDLPTVGGDSPEGEHEKPTRIACPHNRLLEAFHQECPTMPRVMKLSANRRTVLASRWKEVDVDSRFESADDGIEIFRAIFRRAHASDFLSGRSGRFKPGFDWLVKSENFLKLCEGNYDNRSTR
jgi:hypothetical protein